jgi:hypothetical protein
MLTEPQRTRLWENWFFAEVRACYFGDLSARYHRLHRIATWGVLLFSSSALGAVTVALPPWAAPALVLVAAGLGLYLLVVQYEKRAVDAADLHLRWTTKARAYERLWEDMYAEDALARLDRAEDSDPDLSKAAMALPWEPKRMEKWQTHVERMHKQRAAA